MLHPHCKTIVDKASQVAEKLAVSNSLGYKKLAEDEDSHERPFTFLPIFAHTEADIMKLKRPGSGEARSNEPDAALMRATYVALLSCCRVLYSQTCARDHVPSLGRPLLCVIFAILLQSFACRACGPCSSALMQAVTYCGPTQVRTNARDRRQGLPRSILC